MAPGGPAWTFPARVGHWLLREQMFSFKRARGETVRGGRRVLFFEEEQMADFDLAIGATLAREGGARYTNDPGDAGGETRYGISKRAYPEEDIALLTEQRAREIYKRDYWQRLRAGEIESQAVAGKLFDTAVNMGPRACAKLVQQCLEIEPVDGVIGPQTLAVINAADPEQVLLRFTLAQVVRYVHIVKRRPGTRKFMLGWLNRALGEV